MAKIFHPLLALIASATDRELAKYVEYLKAENQILRARITGQIHFIRVPGNQLRLLQAEMRILSWQFKIIAFCMVKEILVYIFTLNRLCFPSALRQTSAIGLGDRLF